MVEICGRHLCYMATWQGFTLNGIRDSIKFTMEMEHDQTIAFLDVLVRRQKGGISTSVFQKKTHTDRYLNFSSHHHPRVFAGVVACLHRRAANICDSENEKLEVTHLNTVFKANGYTPQCIEPLLQKKYECHQSSATESKQKPPEEENKYLCLP